MALVQVGFYSIDQGHPFSKRTPMGEPLMFVFLFFLGGGVGAALFKAIRPGC